MKISQPSWTTETSSTPYPFTTSFGYDSFITAANFIQYDDFIPVLKTIEITAADLIISIQFDVGVKKIVIDKANLALGYTVKVYDNTRYLGKLVFGYGYSKLLSEFPLNTIKIIDIPFLSFLVKSIPTNCGIYSFNKQFGALSLLAGDHVQLATTGNDVTFNAVPERTTIAETYLKSLNLVGPKDNSVFINSNEIIKVSGQNSYVEISLVGNKAKDLLKSDAILITSDDNI